MRPRMIHERYPTLKNIQLYTLLFQTSIFSRSKRKIKVQDSHFLNYPNQYIAKNFGTKVPNRLMKPFGVNVDTDFKRFDEQCNGMMNEPLIEDEPRMMSYFKHLDIRPIQRVAVHPQESLQKVERRLSKLKMSKKKIIKGWDHPTKPPTTKKLSKRQGRPTTSTSQTTEELRQTKKVTVNRDCPTKPKTYSELM